jgi:hypothetical protein
LYVQENFGPGLKKAAEGGPAGEIVLFRSLLRSLTVLGVDFIFATTPAQLEKAQARMPFSLIFLDQVC